VLGGVTLHLQRFLQYVVLEFTPSTIFLYSSLSPIPGVVSTGLIFPFIYTCTQCLHCIYPPVPFPHLLPSPTGTNSPSQTGRTCSALLFSNFVKEIKWHFCLFKIAT
jgi:hypothetical protein